MKDALDKRITFATSCHRIPVQVDKFKFTKRLKHLFNIALSEIEMQGADIKSIIIGCGSDKKPYTGTEATHCIAPP